MINNKISLVSHFVTLIYILIVIIAWGTNYPLMKLAFVDIKPLTFGGIRLLGGALVIFILLSITKSPRVLPFKNEIFHLSYISVLQFVSVIGLAGISLLFIQPGRTITAIYTMPLWVTLFSVLIIKSKPSVIQLLGVLLSIAGILLFLNPTVIDWNNKNAVIGLMLSLIAAVMWGLGAVIYKSKHWQSTTLSQTFWQLLVGGVCLLVFAFMFEREYEIIYSKTMLLILAWNCIGPTSLAVWAWSKVLNRISATVASQFIMFTPFVGIATSVFMFDEDLPAAFTSSAILIALGGSLSLFKQAR